MIDQILLGIAAIEICIGSTLLLIVSIILGIRSI